MGLDTFWKTRVPAERLIDSFGLLLQAFFVPLVASLVAKFMWPSLFIINQADFQIPFWLQFILPLTIVDYLFYWNHRILHRRKFWWLHRLHHSSKKLDVFVSSRNSVWTIFFLVYLWIHSPTI